MARPAGVLDPPPPWCTTGAGRARFLPNSVSQKSLSKPFQKVPRRPGRATPSPPPPGALGAPLGPGPPHFAREGCQNPPQDGPRRPQDRPRGPQESPRRPQEAPRRPQEAPRRLQEAPRGLLGRLGSHFGTDLGSTLGPGPPENHWFSFGFCGFSYIFAILRKSTKTLRKTTMFKGSGVQLRPQIGPKSVPNPPPRGPGAPETAQDPPEPLPRPSQDLPGSPQDPPRTARDPPRGPQRPPGTPQDAPKDPRDPPGASRETPRSPPGRPRDSPGRPPGPPGSPQEPPGPPPGPPRTPRDPPKLLLLAPVWGGRSRVDAGREVGRPSRPPFPLSCRPRGGTFTGAAVWPAPRASSINFQGGGGHFPKKRRVPGRGEALGPPGRGREAVYQKKSKMSRKCYDYKSLS